MEKRKRQIKSLGAMAPLAIAAAEFLGIMILGLFLPLRIFIGGALIVEAVFLIVLIANIRSPDGFRSDLLLHITIGACLGSLICLIAKGFVYTFIDAPFLPFWEISLILGLFISVFLILKWGRGGKLWAKVVGIPLLALVIALGFIIFISHLNFVLDFHEPVECTARIEEKEHHRHTKSPDTYSFSLTVDGETFDLEVNLLEYERYEKGDTYVFERHHGAFGKSFYISD